MEGEAKGETVECRKRCPDCGATWGLAFVRRDYFEAEGGLRCPFCGMNEAVSELVSGEEEK